MTTLNATFGTPLQGSLTNRATDTYAITASAGGVITLDFTHPGGAGTAGVPIDISVIDALGNVVFSETASGNTSFVTTVAAAGSYTLKVADGAEYNHQDGGTYTLTPRLGTVAGTTYDGASNNTTATAVSSAMGAPIVGSLNNRDIDMFKVHAASGGVLTVALEHPGGAGTAGVPIDIDVLDAAGNVVTTQTLAGNGSFVTTVATAGDYYLRIADGAEYNHQDGGTYKLTPTLVTAVNTAYDGAANNTTATAVSSAMGAAIVGSLNNRDIDMFKVHADSGGVLTLTLTHPDGAGTAGVPIGIDVLDAAGNVVTTQTLSGNGSFVTTVATAGDYYLRIADGAEYNYKDGGTYKLVPTLSTSAGTTYDGATNNGTATAVAGAIGAPIAGSLNNRDIDFFKVSTDSGGVLTLTLAHPGGAGTAGVPIDIDLLDAAGNVVTSQTLSGNGSFVTTVAAAGDYYVRIADGAEYNREDGGIYTLTPTLLYQPGVVYDGAANNTAAAAISAPLSTTVMGSLDNRDIDYFKFSTATGGTLTLNFAHPDGVGSSGSPIDITIVDSSGKAVFTKAERGSDLVNATLASGGDYYLKISDGAEYNYQDGGIYKIIAGMSSGGGITLTGTDTAETLVGTAGNDVINGGAGRDLATYAGNSTDYAITVSPVGTHVLDKTGKAGSDTLFNMERLQFADKMVALDVDGVAGQAYRLYQAAFDRVPDSAGLGYWIGEMDKGASLTSVAANFIQSQEFQLRYGADATNAELVAGFYANVLHRAPDQAGQDYWTGVLDSKSADAAFVLASFSTSAENVAQLTDDLAHGISYTPYG